jgi:hypothetical protein
MKCNATELSSKFVVIPFKFYLLHLVMQLVILCEDLSSRMASARAKRPNKLPNLNNSIRHQLMQLNVNLHQDWMWQHTKPCGKQVFKDYDFIHPGCVNNLRARRSGITLWEVLSMQLHRPNVHFPHS